MESLSHLITLWAHKAMNLSRGIKTEKIEGVLNSGFENNTVTAGKKRYYPHNK